MRDLGKRGSVCLSRKHSPDSEVWGKGTGEQTKDQMECVEEESVKAVGNREWEGAQSFISSF